MVLDDFVFDDTHASFFNGEFCKGDSHLVCGSCSGKEDFVHLFLRESRILFLRSAHASDRFFEFFHSVNDDLVSFHVDSPISVIKIFFAIVILLLNIR